MRTIKFRGKRVNSGEWVESMTISHGTIKGKAYEMFFEIAPDKWVGVIPETVGQFTGVLDKNGKEIYEGDILFIGDDEETKIYNEVGIKDGCFGYIGENNGELLPFCNYNVTEEIAGNIYDNPELINH